MLLNKMLFIKYIHTSGTYICIYFSIYFYFFYYFLNILFVFALSNVYFCSVSHAFISISIEFHSFKISSEVLLVFVWGAGGSCDCVYIHYIKIIIFIGEVFYL